MVPKQQLHRLVIAKLEVNSDIKAVTLYSMVREENGKICSHMGIFNVRSFAKVINQFDDVRHTDNKPLLYFVKKNL